MRTEVCERLGIEYPILAFSHCRDVVAAVTNAGGFGVLGATALMPEELDAELRWIEAAVGDRPFGVDLLFPASYVGSAGDLDLAALEELIPTEHRAFVEDLMRRYDVPELPADEPAQPALALDPEKLAMLAEVAFAHPIRIDRECSGSTPCGAGRAGARARHPGRGARRFDRPRRTQRRGRGRHHRGARDGGRRTHRRDRDDGARPRRGGRGRAGSRARRRRDRPWPSGRGRPRARSAGGLDGLRVAHDRGSRDPPRGEGEVPRRECR